MKTKKAKKAAPGKPVAPVTKRKKTQAEKGVAVAPVIVQAKDGKWDYGPPDMEEAMRAQAKGTFKSAADASEAATKATVEAPRATSSKAPIPDPPEKKIVVSTGPGTGIQHDETMATFIPIGDDRFLTIDNSVIKVVSVPKGSEKRRRWRDYSGAKSLAEAVEVFEKSVLPKTPEAAREICRLLGKPVKEREATVVRQEASARPAPAAKPVAGYSLAKLCEELKIDPFEARKALRAAKAKKPGGRWEWATKDDAKDAIEILKKAKEESK